MEPPIAFGRYEVVEELGRGAFATVWRCTDPVLNSDVAVKVLAPHHAADPITRERFVAEAKVLRQTDGEGRIVAIHDIGETDDGLPYMVMQHADGGTLSERLPEAPLSPDSVRQLIDALVPCLRVLHANGLVHRDLKPSNLLVATQAVVGGDGPLLAAGERIVLGDLGLAKSIASDWDGAPIGGSPSYMPPEQQCAGAIDHRADLFAATAIVARVATGSLPPVVTEGGSVEFDLPAGYPGEFADALRAGMAADPAHRPADADEWAAILRHGLGDRAPSGARRLLIGAASAIAMTLVVLVIVAPWRSDAAVLAVSGTPTIGIDLPVQASSSVTVQSWRVSPAEASSISPSSAVDANRYAIRPVYPRPFTVTAVDTDGRRHDLVLRAPPHPDAPNIDGPVRLSEGESGVWTTDGDCTSVQWAVETASGIQLASQGCTFEFTTRSAGEVYVLASADRGDVVIGSALLVTITP